MFLTRLTTKAKRNRSQAIKYRFDLCGDEILVHRIERGSNKKSNK